MGFWIAIRNDDAISKRVQKESWIIFGQLALIKTIFSTRPDRTHSENSLICIRVDFFFSMWNYRICSWLRRHGVGEICKFRQTTFKKAHILRLATGPISPDVKVCVCVWVCSVTVTQESLTAITQCTVLRVHFNVTAHRFHFIHMRSRCIQFQYDYTFFSHFILTWRSFAVPHVLVNAFQEPIKWKNSRRKKKLESARGWSERSKKKKKNSWSGWMNTNMKTRTEKIRIKIEKPVVGLMVDDVGA